MVREGQTEEGRWIEVRSGVGREKEEKDVLGGQRVIENRQTDRGLTLQKGQED